MTEIELFRETVEAFMTAKGLTPTQFGREYASDPSFVFEIRKGREPRTELRKRILAAIEPAPSGVAA